VIVDFEQRARGRRAFFVDATRRFDPKGFEVAPIERDEVARSFVEAHHYSGAYVAAVRRYGLFARGGALVGVAVFSVPANDLALKPLPGSPRESLELGRFVLLDAVGFNGETWFLTRALDGLAREGWVGVVSFSDPEPRTRRDGEVTFAGHVGQIYQARSAVYLGRATPRTLHLFDDGTVFSARTAQKIRARERGWRHAVAQLVAHGACAPANDTDVDLRAWLAVELPRVTRSRRHHGNHKYLFPLHRSARRACPASLPYPKLGRDLFGARVA
jgi:hypothetical protein